MTIGVTRLGHVWEKIASSLGRRRASEREFEHVDFFGDCVVNGGIIPVYIN